MNSSLLPQNEGGEKEILRWCDRPPPAQAACRYHRGILFLALVFVGERNPHQQQQKTTKSSCRNNHLCYPGHVHPDGVRCSAQMPAGDGLECIEGALDRSERRERFWGHGRAYVGDSFECTGRVDMSLPKHRSIVTKKRPDMLSEPRDDC